MFWKEDPYSGQWDEDLIGDVFWKEDADIILALPIHQGRAVRRSNTQLKRESHEDLTIRLPRQRRNRLLAQQARTLQRSVSYTVLRQLSSRGQLRDHQGP